MVKSISFVIFIASALFINHTTCNPLQNDDSFIISLRSDNNDLEDENMQHDEVIRFFRFKVLKTNSEYCSPLYNIQNSESV